MLEPNTNQPRQVGSNLSLSNLLLSLGVDVSTLVFHNSGNDAFAALMGLQLLLEPETRLKTFRRIGVPNVDIHAGGSTSTFLQPEFGGSRRSSDITPSTSGNALLPKSESREDRSFQNPSHESIPVLRSGYAALVRDDKSSTKSSQENESEEETEEDDQSGPYLGGSIFVTDKPPRAPGRGPRGNPGFRGARSPGKGGRGTSRGGRGRGENVSLSMDAVNLA